MSNEQDNKRTKDEPHAFSEEQRNEDRRMAVERARSKRKEVAA